MWEPRGPWSADVVSTLCRELGLVHAVDPFIRPSLSPELVYWRLHGNKSHYASYTDEELRQLREWLPSSGGALRDVQQHWSRRGFEALSTASGLGRRARLRSGHKGFAVRQQKFPRRSLSSFAVTTVFATRHPNESTVARTESNDSLPIERAIGPAIAMRPSLTLSPTFEQGDGDEARAPSRTADSRAARPRLP